MSKGPNRALKKQLKKQGSNAANYFALLVMDNAMPVIKGKMPLSLSEHEVRKRVRRAIDATIREGTLESRDFGQTEAYLNHCIAAQDDEMGYNPYRDTTLACLAMLNVTNYILQLHLFEHPKHSLFKKLLKPLTKNCPLALLHIYGKHLPENVQQTFPNVTTMFNDYVSKQVKS